MAVASPEKIQNLHDSVLAALTEKFGDAVVSHEIAYDFPVFVVRREKIYDIIKFLKEDPAMGFGFLTTMCGLHYPENKEHEFGMMYQLHNMPENKRIRLKTFFPAHDLVMPTMTTLWDTANWMEREAYDFFGIIFKGHPNLKRILNMEDITFFPLRKDFPLEDPTRDDKDDRMFGR
ncbi:MAG: NADH-quinone oxidoreductase subunit C [Bacteroidia bacterium]